MQNSARFQTTSNFDHEYLRNGSRIGKCTEPERFLPCSMKKTGELWSTNYRVLDVSFTHSNCIFRETIFRGCWPLKLLHALEIDQGLLAQTPNENGGPPQKIQGRTCQIGLKIQGLSAYNFGASGSNVTKLFHATCREVGCSSGHYFWEDPPPIIWKGKIRCDFRQLWTLIVDIFRTDRLVENRISS